MDSKEKHTKILFIRLWESSFIQNDLNILQEKFKVKVVDFSLNKKDPMKTFKTTLVPKEAERTKDFHSRFIKCLNIFYG